MNYYERHIGDYLKDTAHLSLLEHGVYCRLLDVYYTKEVGIEDSMVARLIGAKSKEERAAMSVVLGEFFVLQGGIWTQSRCDREIERYQDKQRKAKASADARWSQTERSAKAMRTHSDGNAPSLQTPDTTEAKASAAPAKPPRASRKCPEGFVVTPEMRAKELADAPGLDIDRETAKFRDHEFAKARSDWAASWRNWIREAFDRQARKPGSSLVTFRERDHEVAAARVHEMTGGLVSAKPITTRRSDALQEVFDATPRLVG